MDETAGAPLGCLAGTVVKRDLREYRRATDRRMLLGFFFLVFIVGDGLIYLIYGQAAAFSGLLCLLIALIPAVMVAGALWLLQRIVENKHDW